ncbi:MAG: CobW family GTP-binding protein, partial [Planctomycetota bacterium]
DLVRSIEELIARPESVEYILLEASGVADPGGITMTLVDDGLRDRIRLDSVTCVVDADQVFAYRQYPAVELLKLRQIGFADMVVLNKVDLAGSEQVRKVRAWIDEHFNRVRVVEASHCDVPMEILLSVGRFDPSQPERDLAVSSVTHGGNGHERTRESQMTHGETFNTWSYETEQAMSLEALREMIKRRLPASVYRCKGLIYTAEQPRHRAILQCVGRRTDLTVADEWGDRSPMTQIVAIGVPGLMVPESLEQLFEGCIADRTEAECRRLEKAARRV